MRLASNLLLPGFGNLRLVCGFGKLLLSCYNRLRGMPKLLCCVVGRAACYRTIQEQVMNGVSGYFDHAEILLPRERSIACVR